jgi:site-specific recombinase XerD
MATVRTCLWFASDAEQAVRRYVELEPGSRIEHVQRSPGPWPGGKAALAQHRHLRGDRVLTSDDGSPVAGHTLHDWVERAQRRAGLAATGNMHILRHTFCSHLAMRGAPPKAIQDLAGHQHLSITMRYMHLSPSERERAIGLLNERAGHGTRRRRIGKCLESFSFLWS